MAKHRRLYVFYCFGTLQLEKEESHCMVVQCLAKLKSNCFCLQNLFGRAISENFNSIQYRILSIELFNILMEPVKFIHEMNRYTLLIQVIVISTRVKNNGRVRIFT
jgi:hypothetical protein